MNKLTQSFTNIQQGIRDNPRYALSWLGGCVGSYAVAGSISWYLQQKGYSPESIATGTLVGKKIGFYTINMGLQTLLHRDRYSSLGEWASEMRKIFTSNTAGAITGSVLSWSLHDIVCMRLLDIKNPLALFLSYPLSGIISTGVKIGLDVKQKVITVKTPAHKLEDRV